MKFFSLLEKSLTRENKGYWNLFGGYGLSIEGETVLNVETINYTPTL